MRRPNGATNVAVLTVAILLGVAALASPQVDRSPALNEFNVDNAVRHVEAIARRPHPLGSQEIERVRQYLVASLEGMGYLPDQQRTRIPDPYGAPGDTAEIVNVMARLPGARSTGAILLMAHYDTHPNTPGANDNSTPVAALLETMRALRESDALANDVIVLFTDAEEPAGRAGAQAFIDGHPWAEDVALVMNFEALGSSGPSLVVQTGRAQTWTIDQVARATHRPLAFSFLTEVAGVMGEIGTDFDPFLAKGTEGVHLAYIRGSSVYHTARDSFDALNRDGLLHHGSYALALARHVGEVDLSAPPMTAESTFFTVLPGWVVRYSHGWTMAAALLALVGGSLAVAADLRRGRTIGRVFARGGGVLAAAVVGSLAAGFAWMGIAGLRPTMGSVEGYAYLGLLILVGAVGRLLLERRLPTPDAASGVFVVWALAAMATAVVVPGISYLFAWPALAASLAFVLWTNPDRSWRVARLAVVSAVAAVVLVPAVDVFLALAHPRPGNLDSEMTEVFMVVALLVMLSAELLIPFLRSGSKPPEALEALVETDQLAAVA